MHFTLLAAAMGALFVAVVLGLWLSSLYLLRDEPPKGMVTGLVHGTVGAVCVALVFYALNRPNPGPGPTHGHAAGSFGWTAFYTLVITLAGGLTILAMHLTRRKISPVLVAMHATAGIAGAVILCAYWVTPSSYGR
jgi:ABC-type transport system involved in cytochrome c biogenesis permease subunit